MLWVSRRAARTDRTRAAALLWGGWVARDRPGVQLHGAASFTVLHGRSGAGHRRSGRYRGYSLERRGLGLSSGQQRGRPSSAGPGVRWPRRRWRSRPCWAFTLLDRTPDRLPWLRWVVVVAGAGRGRPAAGEARTWRAWPGREGGAVRWRSRRSGWPWWPGWPARRIRAGHGEHDAHRLHPQCRTSVGRVRRGPGGGTGGTFRGGPGGLGGQAGPVAARERLGRAAAVPGAARPGAARPARLAEAARPGRRPAGARRSGTRPRRDRDAPGRIFWGRRPGRQHRSEQGTGEAARAGRVRSTSGWPQPRVQRRRHRSSWPPATR